MSEPFVGEIRMFAGTFAPRGWALCDGQLLAISSNDALFSLLGTIYGGDGRTTFGLPDLRGRLPIHAGSGPGLSPRRLGATLGVESVTLGLAQLPSHGHVPQASTAAGTQSSPAGAVLASAPGVRIYRPTPPVAAMHASAITSSGGNGSHNNVMPFQCLNFIIALVGIYPSRT